MGSGGYSEEDGEQVPRDPMGSPCSSLSRTG